MEILAFIPPILIGSAIVVILFPDYSLKGACSVFTVCLGAGIGLGITSSTIFLWLAWFGRPDTAYFVFEAGSAILLSMIAFYRFHFFKSGSQNEPTSVCATNGAAIQWLKRLCIILLLISAGSFALKSFIEYPHGTVDARFVWNYRARWMFRGGEHWDYAFYTPVASGAEDTRVMDYAPDYKYYTSDVTRIWPVNGKFTNEQKALYNYIVAYRDALFKYIKPGVTAGEVLDLAAADMKQYLEGKTFANPAHKKAVEEGLKFRGHFQHPVGMAVHDVGQVHGVPLKPGMVFTIDPMIWIHEERLYIRIEDMALVTENGVENLSAFVPSSIENVERTIKEKGVIEFRPAVDLPLKK